MPSWEETKRAAQSAYTSLGNGYQDITGSIGNAYQQILLTGHLYPSVGNSDVNRQIAEDAYQPTPEDGKEYERYRDEWDSQNPDSRMTGPDPDAPEPER